MVPNSETFLLVNNEDRKVEQKPFKETKKAKNKIILTIVIRRFVTIRNS